MSFDFLTQKLDKFYDSFEVTLNYPVSEGFITVNHLNKLVTCRVVSPLQRGKILVLKSGNSYFATQKSVMTPNSNREVKEIETFRLKQVGGVAYIIIVLSEKIPINIELRNNYVGDVNLIPNLQVIEDIYVVDYNNLLSGLTLSDLRFDQNPSLVTEPYLSFYNFLKKNKTYPYKSFYNYLTDTIYFSESLTEKNFILDNDLEAEPKLRILNNIFPDFALGEKLNVITAVKSPPVYPYFSSLKPLERPNQNMTFITTLLKFYSSYLGKIKNLVVLNNLIPTISEYVNPLVVEIIAINPVSRELTVKQLSHLTNIFTVSVLNNINLLVGDKGVVRYLIEGNYFEKLEN